jgi:spermidine synthase
LTNKDENKLAGTRLNKAGFLFVLKWLTSFIWPVKLDKHQTENSSLEVVLYNGRIMLNSARANYSYGNLQLAYKRLFKEVELPWNSFKSALVLGFGAGGVSTLLHKYQPDIRQVGVELSSEVLGFYHRYFDPVPGVELVCADALQFVKTCEQGFDFIVIDLYEDLHVPEVFQTREFVSSLTRLLNENGMVLFNKVVGEDDHRDQLNDLLIHFSTFFKSVSVNEQLSLNHFILAKKTSKRHEFVLTWRQNKTK